MFKKQEGITLVALVITIIVLLILAGVSIAMIAGDNGVLKKARDSKNVSINASMNENAALNSYDKYMQNEMPAQP